MNPLREGFQSTESINKNVYNMISLDTKFFVSLGLFGSCSILLLGCMGLSIYHSDTQHSLARSEREKLGIKIFKAQEDINKNMRDLNSIKRYTTSLEKQLISIKERVDNPTELKNP